MFHVEQWVLKRSAKDVPRGTMGALIASDSCPLEGL